LDLWREELKLHVITAADGVMLIVIAMAACVVLAILTAMPAVEVRSILVLIAEAWGMCGRMNKYEQLNYIFYLIEHYMLRGRLHNDILHF